MQTAKCTAASHYATQQLSFEEKKKKKQKILPHPPKIQNCPPQTHLFLLILSLNNLQERNPNPFPLPYFVSVSHCPPIALNSFLCLSSCNQVSSLSCGLFLCSFVSKCKNVKKRKRKNKLEKKRNK